MLSLRAGPARNLDMHVESERAEPGSGSAQSPSEQLLGQYHRVNDVDDTVLADDVGLHHIGVIDLYFAVLDLDLDL